MCAGKPNHVALPYFVPWLPRDESTRLSTKRFSACLEMSAHVGGAAGPKVAKFRASVTRILQQYPNAVIRSVGGRADKLPRSLLCGTRRRLRSCKFCIVPRGITPSSRRFYEALAAKCVPPAGPHRPVVRPLACHPLHTTPYGPTTMAYSHMHMLHGRCVPVLVADRFVVPYEGSRGAYLGGSTGDHAPFAHGGGTRRRGHMSAPTLLGSAGGGLLPPHALESFVLRVDEEDVDQLPAILDKAMRRHASMYRSLLAYRTAYLYELPRDGHPAAGGAVCAVMAEVTRRFGPHLNAWRGLETAGGNASTA